MRAMACRDKTGKTASSVCHIDSKLFLHRINNGSCVRELVAAGYERIKTLRAVLRELPESAVFRHIINILPDSFL